MNERHEHSHEHGHSHGHDHGHDCGHDHGHADEHAHERGHSHEHGHDHAGAGEHSADGPHDHGGHDHGGGCGHGHSHGHGHHHHHGDSRAGLMLQLVLAGVPVIWLCTGFFNVGQGETAVRVTLGQIAYDPAQPLEPQLTAPGLRWHWPWPIGEVYKLPVASTQTLVLDQFMLAGDKAEAAKLQFKDMLKSRKAPLPPQDLLDAVFEPTLVTGDRNVVQVEMAVRYRVRPPSRDRSRDAADQEKRAAGPGIADLRAKHPDLAAVLETNPRAAGDFVRTQGWNWTFLMPEREAERKDLLEDIFYSSILECVARLPVQDVLTAGRQRMTEYVRRRAQFRLDALGLGVVIDAIEFREVKVPKWVREDFQKVVQAEQLAKIEVSNAESRRSELTTEGQSIADERRKLAAAEADRIVKQARADADTYRKIAAEYRANPELTGERLWNAMMRKIAPVVRLHVVPDTEKVIIQVRSRRE